MKKQGIILFCASLFLGFALGIGTGYADFILPSQQPAQQPIQQSQPPQSFPQQPVAPSQGANFLQPTPMNLFYTPQAFQTQQAAPMAMAYKVVLQKAGDPCAVLEVDPAAHVFRTNDRVRFKFQSNDGGYLYIFQKGSDGSVNKLFPHPAFPGSGTQIVAYREYAVPMDGWFRFDSTPGVESVYLLLSKTPVAELESLPAAGQANSVAVPMNPQAWGVVANYLNRSPRNLLVYTEPGQTGAEGIYQTPVVYAAQMAPTGQGTISAEIQLKHQP